MFVFVIVLLACLDVWLFCLVVCWILHLLCAVFVLLCLVRAYWFLLVTCCFVCFMVSGLWFAVGCGFDNCVFV